jgi:hypothetical protein
LNSKYLKIIREILGGFCDMSFDHIQVRNACPFPVTFYALAGQSFKLEQKETKTAQVCQIWYSARVKGPGNIVNIKSFESWKSDYRKELANIGHDADNIKKGETGVALGAFWDWTVDELFKVPNTAENGAHYFGDKKEGVYGGGSDLVVYATLDPVCKLSSALKLVWYLHLENDHGQKSESVLYDAPDVSKYTNTMYFRLRNANLGTYIETDEEKKVTTKSKSLPYDPLHYGQYWTIAPLESNSTDIKILNVIYKEWLTGHPQVTLCTIDSEDSPALHWKVKTSPTNPIAVLLENRKENTRLCIDSSSRVECRGGSEVSNSSWFIESFLDDMSKIPDGVYFRIMHCATGQYITRDKYNNAILKGLDSQWNNGDNPQIFYLHKDSDNDMKIGTPVSGYLIFDRKTNTLKITSEINIDRPDQHWSTYTPSDRDGLFLYNKGQPVGKNHLYYVNNHFGVEDGQYYDQRWIIQLELPAGSFNI